MKTIPIIGCDFIDDKGERLTTFQLCNEQMKCIGVVEWIGDKVTRVQCVESVDRLALLRIGFEFRGYSIPRQFHAVTLKILPV